MTLKVDFLENEYWWGGDIHLGSNMPFDKNSKVTVLTNRGRSTVQTSPFFLSNKGRYIWSDKGFKAVFDNGIITCDGEAEIILDQSGKTLKDAFLNAKRDRFPYAEQVETARVLYECPQFNTWVELIKEQTEEGVMRYAKGLVKNGYKRGILMIDDGWQKEHGTWQFDSDKFKNPKKMIKKLHKMGFKVMLWVSPYISLSSDRFLDHARVNGIEENNGNFVRLKDGRIAIFKWWNGYCAQFDFTKEADRKHMQEQLDTLVNEYGVDGFKFDGGDYTWKPINEMDSFIHFGMLGGSSEAGCFEGGTNPLCYGWRLSDTKVPTADELNEAWVKFGMRYPLHEYKNTFKTGHLHVISRLHDKSHRWGESGLGDLVPHGLFLGLIGNPFLCPDMVGGGSWINFTEENLHKLDHELFVRMAQCSALFPMMQFSCAPWRVLSKEYAGYCLDMAKLHEKFASEIIKIVAQSEKTGEPILRHMEYEYPNQGYEKILDQFLLGSEYLVAPVLKKGAVTKKVVLPNGKWQDQNDGTIYEGNQTIEVNAPINVLPYFKKVG